jgi:hypothetical protein
VSEANKDEEENYEEPNNTPSNVQDNVDHDAQLAHNT